MNKIFSLSVYGTNPRYLHGAEKQVLLAREFYPDWKIRIYCDKSAFEFLHGIRDVDLRLMDSPQGNGVFWRFLPMFEPDTITMVRDADGRVTQREVRAVEEFLKSPSIFHTFRDHEAHFQYPIIACAFTMKGRLTELHKKTMEQFMSVPFYYTNDQVWLQNFVWPSVEQHALVHDMNTGWFKETRAKLKNRYAFCGNGWDENDMPLYPPTMQEMQGYDRMRLDRSAKFDTGEMTGE